MVGRGSAGQVVATLLAAVHDQPVGPAVNVETGVAADLMSHGLKAHLVPDLLTKSKGTTRRFESNLNLKIETQFELELVEAEDCLLKQPFSSSD